MKSALRTVRVFAAAGMVASGAVASAADKSQYNLFNPTPPALMREMSTDRPDTTESAYTVDAGHIQVEMSFVEWTRDGDFDEIVVAPANLKLGLLNNADLQLVVTPYVDQEDEDDVSGFGDTQLRVKVNLWGNDGETRTALAVMPYLSFPTGDDDVSANKLEGGIIFPFAMELAERWGLGLMAEVDFVRDDEHDTHDVELLHTAAIGHDLTERVGVFVEYIGTARFDGDGDYLAVLGMGVTYALEENVVLDAGVNVGLNDDADDVRLFTGLSFRL
jgi:hypothetical protein